MYSKIWKTIKQTHAKDEPIENQSKMWSIKINLSEPDSVKKLKQKK